MLFMQAANGNYHFIKNNFYLSRFYVGCYSVQYFDHVQGALYSRFVLF